MGNWDRSWDEPYLIYPNTGIKVWGIGLLWYPDLLRPRILKSIRWEMMREGAEDYEYLLLLKRRLDSLPSARLHTRLAKDAQNFLLTVPDKVILYPAVLPAGRDDGWKHRHAYTTSHLTVWQLRNQCARLIQSLPPRIAINTTSTAQRAMRLHHPLHRSSIMRVQDRC